MGPSSLTKEGTQVPCIESMEPEPLDHQINPMAMCPFVSGFSLSIVIMFSRSSHIVTGVSASLLFKSESYSGLWMDHSSTDGHLGLLFGHYELCYCNYSCVSFCLNTHLSSLRYIHRGRIVGSWSLCVSTSSSWEFPCLHILTSTCYTTDSNWNVEGEIPHWSWGSQGSRSVLKRWDLKEVRSKRGIGFGWKSTYKTVCRPCPTPVKSSKVLKKKILRPGMQKSGLQGKSL